MNSTEQTSNRPAALEGTHHWIITVEQPGRASLTIDGSCTPGLGATRRDVFRDVKAFAESKHPDLRGANVVFFALESNQI
ncbi:hypothetical protein [Streptomyces sp. SCSIO ZS0520]|uniref:hypothetical protein n=1 Tax=Streptomyces sp. SCSIO ZS0520 TaxID=2892996 RepID=UPI0021D9FE27|nr:hypothetical protein [Streptomyces sp. SCSIO ZS0520]